MPRRRGVHQIDPVIRFLKKFTRGGADECWLWTAGCFKSGYGEFNAGDESRRAYYAHRFAFEYFVGPIPSGMCVCHTCDNPPCVNPGHLFLGTMGDNNRDKRAKGRLVSGYALRQSKLTDEQVAEIRATCVLRSPTHGATALAKKYGVWPATISRIVRGTRRTYKHPYLTEALIRLRAQTASAKPTVMAEAGSPASVPTEAP